jgi:hypothetical protein
MGYQTNYTLEVPGEVSEPLQDFLERDMTSDFPLICLMEGRTGSWRWYEWMRDMRRVSKKFPRTLFILSGEGETPGDLWKAYFLGGKVQVCKARITFEDFDESKLGINND